MKRFFILASAAIVALASCAKTEVVYTDGPQEIAFKQITSVMTKATEGLGEDVAMGVFAYTVPASGSATSYFGNTSFNYDGSAYWIANPKLYYPIQGELDFAYYAPYAADFSWNGYTELKSSTVTSLDVSTTPYSYGKTILRSAKNADALSVELGRAVAQVTINVKTDATSAGYVKINSITLSGVKTTGKLTVTYAENNGADASTAPYTVSNVVWAADAATSLVWTGVETPTVEGVQYGTNYILAGYEASNIFEQGELSVSYSIDKDGSGSGSVWFDGAATFDLSSGSTYWHMGKNYIYDVMATLTEIKFTPSVDKFEDVTPNVTVTL